MRGERGSEVYIQSNSVIQHFTLKYFKMSLFTSDTFREFPSLGRISSLMCRFLAGIRISTLDQCKQFARATSEVSRPPRYVAKCQVPITCKVVDDHDMCRTIVIRVTRCRFVPCLGTIPDFSVCPNKPLCDSLTKVYRFVLFTLFPSMEHFNSPFFKIHVVSSNVIRVKYEAF